MLRAILIAAAMLTAGSAVGQEAVEDADVDFIMRPTNEPDDDFWVEQLQPEEIRIDEDIGPPMFGPTGDEPLGPPMAGPSEVPPEPLRDRRIAEEDDPFAPTGIALGTFIIRPSIEVGVNLTDNPAGTTDKDHAAGLILEPEIEVSRDGSRFDVEGVARGQAIFYGDDEFDEREAEARIATRYALTGSTEIETEAGYTYSLDRFTDPNTPAAAAERPPVHDFDAALGVTQEFARLAVGVSGEVERSVHDDVELDGGLVASREELDNTDYGVRVRASYEVSPALTPFVEAAVGRREFDQEFDDNGFQRSSDWGELRGGLIFDRGSKLRGEIAAGYRREDLDDPNLDDLEGMVADASILWSPRRLTEVRFDLSTEVRPTSVADSAGSILYAGSLTLARRVSSRFRIETGAGLEREHFQGIDRDDMTYTGFAGVTYAFNRTASIAARYTYEQTDSDDPAADTQSNTVGVRIRIQR